MVLAVADLGVDRGLRAKHLEGNTIKNKNGTFANFILVFFGGGFGGGRLPQDDRGQCREVHTMVTFFLVFPFVLNGQEVQKITESYILRIGQCPKLEVRAPMSPAIVATLGR